ncbi:Vacuolar amino acid transporter 2 [Ceratocystis platani]|uniref:Vacuolar amino acid transporter 2 n=1 Tax=Ceratocystis fimbriata f. sp. platani TaxID=88771 RepID=A0A0F8BMC9_CERFI|nr:Vacuolar amino acid transporter 2 [Ceratocystis platani]
MSGSRLKFSRNRHRNLLAGHGSTNPDSTTDADAEERGLLDAQYSDDDGEGDRLVLNVARTRNPQLVATQPDSESPKTPRSARSVRFDLTPTYAEAPHTHFLIDDAGRKSEEAMNSRRPSSVFDRADIPFFFDNDGPDADGPRRGGHEMQMADNAVAQWAENERSRPKSSLKSAFMNMANSIIGAGIIGQPYAFKQAGLLAGVFLLIVLTIAVDWTIRLIVINAKLSGTSSFQSTVQYCFGRRGMLAISLAQWAFAFGGMVAFAIVVGDSIPVVFRAIWPDLNNMGAFSLLGNRRVVITVFVLGLSYPLTLYRDIAKLAKASTFALISMLIIIVTVLIQSLRVPADHRGSMTPALWTINSGVTQAIGVISFAFVCHHNSLLIYGSLRTPTIDRFSTVTHLSTGVSMIACMTMALSGFLTFGDKTAGNVLNNFPADNTMVTFARLCFGLNMLTTLPLEAFVCREVMVEYFFSNTSPPPVTSSLDPDDDSAEDRPFVAEGTVPQIGTALHVLISTALVVAALGVSLATCDLGAIFELVGATSACALAYILPPLCYIKLTTKSWRTYVAMGVAAFGSLVMVITVVQALTKIIMGGNETAQCV